jgi:hypothetical protein
MENPNSEIEKEDLDDQPIEKVEQEENQNEPKKNKKDKRKNSKKTNYWKWPLIVLLLSFTLSFLFSLASEFLLNGAGLIIAILVIVIFLIISIISDMIGVACTAATETPFRAMASRKVRGAKEAIIMVKNADKVGSIFGDILGDICGILSGAAGAAIAIMLITNSMSGFEKVLIASAISSIIASLIIFGKAIFKKYSIKHCENIVLICGKIMSIFHRQKKN